MTCRPTAAGKKKKKVDHRPIWQMWPGLTSPRPVTQKRNLTFQIVPPHNNHKKSCPKTPSRSADDYRFFFRREGENRCCSRCCFFRLFSAWAVLILGGCLSARFWVLSSLFCVGAVVSGLSMGKEERFAKWKRCFVVFTLCSEQPWGVLRESLVKHEGEENGRIQPHFPFRMCNGHLLPILFGHFWAPEIEISFFACRKMEFATFIWSLPGLGMDIVLVFFCPLLLFRGERFQVSV